MNRHHTILKFTLSIITALLVLGVFIVFIKIIQNKNRHTSKVLQILEQKIQDEKRTLN